MRAQCESERQVEELFPASSTTAKVEEVEAKAGAGGGGVGGGGASCISFLGRNSHLWNGLHSREPSYHGSQL